MLRRSFALLAFVLLALPALPVVAQDIPTLTLGSAAAVQLLPPGEIEADGKKISVTIVVTDENGALASGVRFRGSTATAGRLDQDCPQVGPGLYSCGYVTPDHAVTSAELRVRARLQSGAQLDSIFPVDVVPRTRARIAFNANPAELILTQDPSSSIAFTVTDEAGNVLDGLDLRATANVGQVQAITGAGSGTYTALYVPPTTPFPQVALVSVWDANDPDKVFGFFRIPLVGKVSYPVDARGAGVTLIFTVGDRTFPPVVSDASGRASVPILVTPGVRFAQVELIQPSGTKSTQQIDLQVPTFNQIALGGVPVFLPADGERQARIRIFAVDRKGRPADGQNISMTASQGAVTGVRFVGNGLYEASFTAPWSDAAGTATITAALESDPASTDSVEIGLEPAPPTAISLTANPAQITPDDKKSTLTAALVDGSGAPAKGKSTVEFRTADGPIKNPKSAGKATFSADVPVQWNVRTRVQAIAAVRGNRQAVRQVVALPMNDWVMTGQQMPLTVLSLDRYGNPVADVAINCTVEGGGGSVTGSVQTDARGLGTIVFTAGPLAGFAAVRIAAGDVSYSAPLWQSSEPMKKFEFPVSGGQRQGRTLAKWRKLRATVDLGSDPEPEPVAAAEPVTGGGGGVWGTGGDAAVGQDSGSVGSAGAAAKILVSSIPASVEETGGRVNILVKVTDAAGILVPGEAVILIADAGTISGKTDNGDGTFSAILTIPPDSGKTSVQVTATRPAGDIAGFAKVTVGEQVATGGTTKKPKKPKKPGTTAAATAAAGDRMKRRWGRAWIGWAPGGYTYNSNPCVPDSDPCDAPDDSALDDYDFLKVEVRGADGESPMPIPGSFSMGGEVFLGGDLFGFLGVGPRFTYARLAYTTDFAADSGDGDSHCATHFCDGMSFVNLDAQVRFTLLKDKGPLEVIVRPIGYQFQDVVLFRRLYSESTGAREPRFETIGLHGLRFGVGARFTVIPMVQPHVDYNFAIGLRATLGEAAFGVPGVTNHNLAVGVSVFPWNGLLVDATYDLTTRSLGLAFDNEEGVHQRGSLSEQAHTLRVSAGWAF